jgi:hypothetical protein
MDAGARIRVATDALRELKVFVTLPASEVARIEAGSVPFSLVAKDVVSLHETARATQFQKPAGRQP